MMNRKNFAAKEWIKVPRIDWDHTTSEVRRPAGCAMCEPRPMLPVSLTRCAEHQFQLGFVLLRRSAGSDVTHRC